MKRLINALLVLSIPCFSFSQQNNELEKKHFLQVGTGTIGYMNSYSLPAGLTGYNYSGLYNYKIVKGINSSKITYFNLYFNYARLANNHGEKTLNKPTKFYTINFDYEKFYHVVQCSNNLWFYAGFNLGITSNFCHNPYFNFNLNPKVDNTFMLQFGYWNSFSGINTLLLFKNGNFTIENKITLPCLMYGFFLDYQNHPTTIEPYHYIKHTRFVSFINYTEVENSLSVFYSGLRLRKKPLPVFISFAFINHKSDINCNIQEFRKNTIYVGFIVK